MTMSRPDLTPRIIDRQARISVVVPVFNEEEAAPHFCKTVAPYLDALGLDWEIVFSNDGSSDDTLSVLVALRAGDPRIKIVDLTRNFGKEAAMTAGLDHATGDMIVVMDVDLQDPPNLLAPMVERWREGYDVVCGRRRTREDDTALKRLTAGQFYRFFNRISHSKIPPDVGDFRLMDRRVVEAMKLLPERVRFMKGLFAWVGFPTAVIDYERPSREHGATKFNYWRLWNFALDGITSFSTVPLRVWTYFGMFIAFISFIYGAFIIAQTLIMGVEVPGYASSLTAVLFLGGVQLVGLGIIGEYLGRVYSEVKRRPVYLASRLHGLDEQDPRHEHH
ncbi:glycosyltransferase family 2 protein [Pararhizobium haloflavum]|uniref:glycosyltransferase family 2 protein n=1 Tax=Pararhizobium haloflavum TaxID=2037914 RepID=UPI001FE07674|nr:glycosyltransferase family 2 protein [Pararhizobium haloflavum]